MKKRNAAELLVSVAVAELTGVLSGLIAGNSSAFYKTLAQPPLSPPGWVFPVVWTVLYALMGVAAYLVFSSDAPWKSKQAALIVYGVQLAVNFLWSIVFFRFHQFWPAAVLSAVLAALVLLTMVKFGKASKTAAWLMLPYLLWTLFATYLAVGVALLNP